MRIAEPMISELRRETGTTRRMLERAPDDKLGWRPHEKSMTLGRLVRHLADLPGLGQRIFNQDELVVDPALMPRPVATSTAEALEIFDRNVDGLVRLLEAQDDDAVVANWRFRVGERLVFEGPRAAAFRALALSHSIHHRGQLSVYLRLLDVPLPPVYGPTADESL